MIKYIVRRLIYSLLVIIGVLIVTFFLFRVAAGDPAAAVLGKNPSPMEVENLRMELASDKPLIWGNWRRTEIYTSVNFAEKRELPGFKTEGIAEYKEGLFRLNGGKIIFQKNFEMEAAAVKAEIVFRGTFSGNGATYYSKGWEEIEILLPGTSLPDFFTVENTGMPLSDFRSVKFYRQQRPPWDSQLLASLKELVQFRPSFPYLSFLNFGRTLISRESIRRVLWRGVWPSLMLMLPIFWGELLLGVAIALFSTAFRGSWPDRIVVLFSVAGMSISYLAFIIFGQWYLAYYFNWFPVWGFGTLRHLMLPVLIGIISGLGGGVRFYRTIFINELNKEYLITAEAKGCSGFSVYCKHLLRNAAIPLIARVTTVLPFLFTGSLLLESFFGIPGLGYEGINALMNSDLQMLKALVILTALIFVIVNLFADVAYAWADPRIRLESR